MTTAGITAEGPLHYLDHPTTSWPKAAGVAEAMALAIALYTSPARGQHPLGRAAGSAVEAAREAVADLVGAATSKDVVFTAGATAALNIAIHSFARPGRHVVTTVLDHNAVLRPLTRAKRLGAGLTILRPSGATDAGLSFADALRRALRPNTSLVAVTHASNVTGEIVDVAELATLCADAGVRLLVDASQTVGHLPVRLDGLGMDLLAFGGHKGLGGPPGVGVLACNAAELPLEPVVQGGTGVNSEELDPSTAVPEGLETGTQNVPAIAGLHAALDDAPAALERERQIADLADMAEEMLTRRGAIVARFGPGPRLPVLAFHVPGLDAATTLRVIADEGGVLARAGLHCAPLAHHQLGSLPGGLVRIGFGRSNSVADVQALEAGIDAIRVHRSGTAEPIRAVAETP